MFWRLPWLRHVIYKEHATAIQFLQSRGREQQYLCRSGRKIYSALSQPPSMGERGRTRTRLPWNCKQGHCLQGRAQHQCLELAPSQKIPGYGSGDGGRRADSAGRPTASSDAQPGSRRELGDCGNGAGVLGSHRWGCRKEAGIQNDQRLNYV